MGAVFRPKDLPGVRKRIIEDTLRDLSPDVKDNTVQMIQSWERTGSIESEEKLKGILGQDKAEDLFRKITRHKNEITYEEHDKLENMFRESVTFD